ncbi:BICD family-like cargo adapter 2 [Clupea harengus]|uniref:BICD family-like cargo adapter 2 n=1 Tax=Clupea harengus TaxID=7950 RepID=A0A6P8FMB4_CLUHA|nr:BICD family-like cargo adapter 2 [Clupea harengus]
MFSSKKENLPSPSLEDSFFPFSSSSSASTKRTMGPGVVPEALSDLSQDDGCTALQESDLVLAAELGQALLERNEELNAQLEQKEKEVEAVQQEKHTLQRKLDVCEMEAAQREHELQADLATQRKQLEQQHAQGKGRRREESEQLTQLSNHNQKLVEQLAEAVSLEHALRSELRLLRDEMEEDSFSRSIRSARVDSLHAENRVLQERYTNLDKRLSSTQDDNDRLRSERDMLRERVMELQTSLRDRESELEQEHSTVFQLHTLNRTLQHRVQALGEEVSLGETTSFPLSLQSEIQQSQAKEALLAHSEILQVTHAELQKLKQELQTKEEELLLLRKELKPFRSSPGKCSYSSLEEELLKTRQDRDSLNLQLLSTIKHKVALSQEVDAWQEDMRLVICQQVQIQEEEKQKKVTPLQRGSRTSKSLRLRGEDGKRDKNFFSSLFGGK